jgi:hypothetical protein
MQKPQNNINMDKQKLLNAKAAWAAEQQKYPILRGTSLKAAYRKLSQFKDNPQGLLENYIDGCLTDQPPFDLTPQEINKLHTATQKQSNPGTFSRAKLTLYYLGTQKNILIATSTEIFNYQDEAAAYLYNLIPAPVRENIEAKKQEAEDLWQSFFSTGAYVSNQETTDKYQETQKEINALYKPYIVMRETYYTWSCFSGALTNEAQTGTIIRVPRKKGQATYAYFLPTATIELIHNKLTSQI